MAELCSDQSYFLWPNAFPTLPQISQKRFTWWHPIYLNPRLIRLIGLGGEVIGALPCTCGRPALSLCAGPIFPINVVAVYSARGVESNVRCVASFRPV